MAALVAQARRTRSVVRQNLLWAAIYNAACVPLAILGYMPTWLAGFGMAASSLLVVANSARLARACRRTDMDILFLLIPLSVVLALLIIGALGWAVWRGQFEALEQEAERILHDD